MLKMSVSEFETMVCNALGLDPVDVKKLVITMVAGRPPMVDAEMEMILFHQETNAVFSPLDKVVRVNADNL